MTFNKRDAARLLYIDPRTLTRWMRSGKIAYRKTGAGTFAEVEFDGAELQRLGAALPQEPTPHAVPVPKPAPQPAPEPLPETDIERRIASDLEFAQRYLRSEVPDSCGNYCDGSNARWLSKCPTLLGPSEPVTPERPSTTAHMVPALITGKPLIGTDGELVEHAGSDSHPLLSDFKPLPTRKKPLHPNFTRQALLTAILRDIRAGYSR